LFTFDIHVSVVDEDDANCQHVAVSATVVVTVVITLCVVAAVIALIAAIVFLFLRW